MPDRSLESLRQHIGESIVVVEDFVVEAGKVAEFAAAIGDESPIHRDADMARRHGLRVVPAPVTFVRSSAFPHHRVAGVGSDPVFDLGFDPRYELHGEQAYELQRPVYVGDVLSGTATLTDVYQRKGKNSQLTFAVEELEFCDADDEPVLTERMTFIEAVPEDD